MKCNRFRTGNLRNEEWFQFYTEVKELIDSYDPESLDIAALFSVFVVLYGDVDTALEIIRKSITTERIANADTTRDNTFRGFADAVKSACNHFDAEKRDAAKYLQNILDHYGNIARKLLDEETASIYNLVQEVRVKPAYLTLLGLTDWVDQLEIENKAFEALMEKRYSEESSKTTLKMKELRVETDRCYRSILDRIDALILINGKDRYADFVKELDVRSQRFENMLAARKGRVEAGKKKNNDNAGE